MEIFILIQGFKVNIYHLIKDIFMQFNHTASVVSPGHTFMSGLIDALHHVSASSITLAQAE